MGVSLRLNGEHKIEWLEFPNPQESNYKIKSQKSSKWSDWWGSPFFWAVSIKKNDWNLQVHRTPYGWPLFIFMLTIQKKGDPHQSFDFTTLTTLFEKFFFLEFLVIHFYAHRSEEGRPPPIVWFVPILRLYLKSVFIFRAHCSEEGGSPLIIRFLQLLRFLFGK